MKSYRTGLLGEMADSRAGAENIHNEPGASRSTRKEGSAWKRQNKIAQ